MTDAAPFMMTVVAAALVDPNGRVLLQQRPAGTSLAGLWEFPGGKVEPGETPELALVRELDEELAIAAAPADLVPLAFASEPLAGRHLLLLLYVCRRWTGEPRAVEAAGLRWLDPAAMPALPMPPADRPLVAALRAALAG